MKKLILFLELCIISLCFSIPVQSADNLSSETQETLGNTTEHQSLSSDCISNQNLTANNWMSVDIPKVGLKNVTIGCMETGCTVTADTPLPVYIFCDYERFGGPLPHDSYLAAATDSEMLFKDLDVTSYADALYLCDVDGDLTDEIIIQQTVGMSGGAGQYVSRIFKITESEIREIFTSQNINQFDTGFTGELKNNFTIEIKNSFTGYSETFYYGDDAEYFNWCFDENGEILKNESITADSFREFTPEDTDGDGIFELVCLQYTSLGFHACYIGDIKSVLKYNMQTGEFEVVKAEFIQRTS